MILRLSILLIFFCLNCSRSSASPPKAVKGVLDLSGWDFDSSGDRAGVNIDGEWEFYWGELLEPNSVIDHSKMKIENYGFISVPGSWNKFSVNGIPVGAKGYATYRLKVYLEKPVKGLTLKAEHIGTAYKLWVNGKLLAQAGTVSREEKTAKPGYFIKSFLLSESYKELDIIIQSSNYHDRYGGIWRSFILGTDESIANKLLLNHFFDFFLFGSLLLMGVYHLGIYSLRKKDSSALWFGLFSILISIRPLLVGESLLYILLPDLWVILNKIEYLTVYAGLPLFANFINSMFPYEFHSGLKRQIDILGLFFSALVVFLPSYWYSQTLVLFQIFLILSLIYLIFVLARASQRGRTGAKTFLAGWIFIFAALINDILYTQLIIMTTSLFPFGFLIFVFSQAFVLSMRYSMSFNYAENLSNDLQKLSQNLENKISEGVREQQKYSECLLELSKSKTIELFGLESALKEVTETCAGILEIERCSIWIFNRAGDEIQCQDLFLSESRIHKKGQTLKETDFPAYFSTIKECSVISAPDIFSHPATRDFMRISPQPFSICSLLDAPIRSGGKLIGILCCEQAGVRKDWTREEENFAASLASILASFFDWNDRQAAFSELTEAKQEIEDLNQFTYLVNSLSELDDIFSEVCKYVYIKYDIANIWLFLPDERRENLYSYKAYSYNDIFNKEYDNLMSRKIPLTDEKGGMLNLIFRRKKPFYINRLLKFKSAQDREFTEILSLRTFLYVPLVRKDQCVGIFAFGSLNESMHISKTEIRKLSNVCSRIAGAVDTKHLLQQVEKAKRETEALNALIKSLNEDLDIRNIMKKVLEFVNKNFNIQFFALYNVNSEKKSISLLDINFPDYITEEDRKKIMNLRISISSAKSAHAFVFKTEKPYYLPKVKKNGGSKEELFIINIFKIQSILLIPLILNNELIGILDFSNSSVMNLSGEDIKQLSVLSEQLAGIIYGSYLFKELKAAKVQAEIDSGIAFLAQGEAELERGKSERLLLNILPSKVADELKEKGFVEPVFFESASIMFTDFKGFTQIAEGLTPQELIKELDRCFSAFDQITERNRLEKLKTIGDGYMCAGGIPKTNGTHAADCCLAALEIQSLMNQLKEQNQKQGKIFWELRLGIHSGPVIAGVVGERKFAYDVWGDTVNTASRMESSGTPGKINISGSTYELIKDVFDCDYRGRINAKNKGQVDMYYVNGIRKEFSVGETGLIPNEKFWEMIESRKSSSSGL